MERLTQQVKFSLDTFLRCQLCGYVSNDICEFRMLQECDDEDNVEPYNVLVICDTEKCWSVIRRHPRLYRTVPWGQGQPGHFMLLCGPCQYRDVSKCSHLDLKINGGEGLNLYKDTSLPNVIVCYHDETREGGMRCDLDGFPSPFTLCKGFKEKE